MKNTKELQSSKAALDEAAIYSRIKKIDAFLGEHTCGGDTNREFGDQSGNILVDWLGEVNFSKKFTFSEAARIPLSDYKEMIEYNKRNTYAVGASFDTMFAAFVMMCAGSPSFGASYALGGTIYEHIFLAGYEPSKKAILDLILTLNVPGAENNIQSLAEYLKDELLSLGIDLEKNSYNLSGSLLAQQYLVCCGLQKLRGARMRGKEPSPWAKELTQGYHEYTELITVVRAMSKGVTNITFQSYDDITLKYTSPRRHLRIDGSVIGAFLRETLPTYNKLIEFTHKSLKYTAAVKADEM